MNNPQANLEIIKDLSATGYANTRSLGELNLRIWEKLAEKQMDAFGLLIDTGIQQVKLASETRDVNVLVNAQVELTKQLSEGLVAKGREAVEVANEARDDYRAWLESGVSTFTTKVNEVANAA